MNPPPVRVKPSVGDPAPTPPRLRSESEVVARWSSDRPVVSVICPAYQHAGFIKDAIHGFLGQDTDFPFEVVIRDDASTDGTAEIVRDYAQRYPNVIRAVLETENRYRKEGGGAVLRSMARGEFIATCEGDDYWTDPRKLQIQHDGLVDDPAAVASHHAVTVVRDGSIVHSEKRARRQCRDFSADELARNARIITCSVMRRNVPLLEPQKGAIRVDMWTRARLGLHGGARWEGTIAPSVHRLHGGGIWSPRTESERVRLQHEHFTRFAEEFQLSRHPELARYYRRLSLALRLYGSVASLHPAVERLMASVRRRTWGT